MAPSKQVILLSLAASASAFTGNTPVFHRATNAQRSRSVRLILISSGYPSPRQIAAHQVSEQTYARS